MSELGGAGSAQNVLKHIKLHVAALQGDLETAKKYENDLQLPITQNGETALHIAILAGQKEFVKKLVEWFGMPILEIQDEKGNDALSYAARIGSLDMVNVIVDVRDSIYLSLKSKKKALLKAASLGHTDITKRLSKLIDLQLLEDEEARRLYICCVEMGLYGEFYSFFLTDCPYGLPVALPPPRETLREVHATIKKRKSTSKFDDEFIA
ncbi:hypothetical protein FEM48_Zijuj03G0055300 [Ziziphus jujuba var. spinosa]|uniref:Uncharacterized protein n=1 Tax=Ziziphus jujuba var. spinosa TaxID=714518 RepID=A0A978VNG7_ZIZJJ|nr:hypothetical protein FEM48_Zijuj03G0055300 [Ziziphus jujuba var. spinosa]